MKHKFSPPHQELIRILRSARERARFTQRELSDRLNRSRSFIHRVENGDCVPSYLEANEIAKFLNVDPHEMLDQVLVSESPPPEIDPIVVTGASEAKARAKPKKKR